MFWESFGIVKVNNLRLKTGLQIGFLWWFYRLLDIDIVKRKIRTSFEIINDKLVVFPQENGHWMGPNDKGWQKWVSKIWPEAIITGLDKPPNSTWSLELPNLNKSSLWNILKTKFFMHFSNFKKIKQLKGYWNKACY
jgi:hypothetical protein